MYWSVPVILLTAALISCEAAPNSTNKDLVDVLKLKLRKNNDDYDELLQENSTSSILPTRSQNNLTVSIDNQVPKFNVTHLRRSFDEPKQIKQDISATQQDFVITLPDTKVITDKIKNIQFKNENKVINKEKMEKFKKFMSKNKNLFNEFMSKKRTAQNMRAQPATLASQTTTVSPGTPPVPASHSATVNQLRMRLLTTLLPPKASAHNEKISPEAEESKFRAYMQRQRPLVVSTPRGEQLDMAPAKGGKIHIMRLKGRLCQRNVMLPEGPKYDSKGRMYLGGYTNKYGRDYAHTRRPKLLLPRCCNCCKKSVLGCE